MYLLKLNFKPIYLQINKFIGIYIYLFMYIGMSPKRKYDLYQFDVKLIVKFILDLTKMFPTF